MRPFARRQLDGMGQPRQRHAAEEADHHEPDGGQSGHRSYPERQPGQEEPPARIVDEDGAGTCITMTPSRHGAIVPPDSPAGTPGGLPASVGRQVRDRGGSRA
jgi:hypothetical protein